MRVADSVSHDYWQQRKKGTVGAELRLLVFQGFSPLCFAMCFSNFLAGKYRLQMGQYFIGCSSKVDPRHLPFSSLAGPMLIFHFTPTFLS